MRAHSFTARFRAPVVALVTCIALVAFGVAPAAATVPTITSFSPTSGTLGTTVTITGSAFTGASAVKFHGASSTFSVLSSTKIRATVPTGASTGPISVTTPGGTRTTTSNFTVHLGIKLSRTSGAPTTVVAVTGAGFDPNVAVDIDFGSYWLGQAVTNSTGDFGPESVIVPRSAPAGTESFMVVERTSNAKSAAASFVVNTDWAMFGFGASSRHENPYEGTISTSNANGLTEAWASPTNSFGNQQPFVEVGGNLYVGDVLGDVFAYSSAGTLLWTAHPGGDLQFIWPAAYGGRVFFGGNDGNVHAYLTNCRTDGGVCSAAWTANVGVSTTVTAGLTVWGGVLYVPASDGMVHLFTPATGAVHTSIVAWDAAHGAVTTPVAFTPDGSYYYGTGTSLQIHTASGLSGLNTYAGTMSPLAIWNTHAYYTTSDGNVHEFNGWTKATSGSGCAPAPAIANNVVFALGCTNLQAFDAGTGAVLWTATMPGTTTGVTVANGVLYTCANNTTEAYSAASGAHLWTGGGCSTTPLVANGTVYETYAGLQAYDLTHSS
jgi:hypothetical protein